MNAKDLIPLFKDPQAACDGAGHHHRVIEREQLVGLKRIADD
jgi:hypothetical protein